MSARKPMGDPRVHFAAERTLLAWIRSGLTMMALGIALMVLGIGVILGALLNHRSYVGSLPVHDVPRLAIPWLTPFLAGMVAAVGLLLAGYLGIT
jgi:putative membrane protein